MREFTQISMDYGGQVNLRPHFPDPSLLHLYTTPIPEFYKVISGISAPTGPRIGGRKRAKRGRGKKREEANVLRKSGKSRKVPAATIVSLFQNNKVCMLAYNIELLHPPTATR